MQAADGTTLETDARARRAPGRYEASVVADARQPLTISLDGPELGHADAPRRARSERRVPLRPADEAQLKSIADATGGAFRATPDALRAHRNSPTARRALWPGLVVAALLLWMIDVLFRRVRVFERVS